VESIGNIVDADSGGVMARYYVRVEGINLDSFVFDTEDLSCVRGGSLLLLEAVKELPSKVAGLTAIATGASIGLFSADTDTPDDLRKNIYHALQNCSIHSGLKHATFAVDIVAGEGKKWGAVAQELMALNRWRQMRSPSFAIPSGVSDKGACEIDMARPAVKKDEKGTKEIQVSDSVFLRRQFGKKQKKQFYIQETGIADLPGFVNDFSELTTDQSGNSTFGFLNHKMAVIYIDGNSFGKIKERLEDSGKETEFSMKIKGYRKEILIEILSHAKGDQANWLYGDAESPKIRMETLIWGGDEVLWAVPAWVGWWTLAQYYKKSSDWEFDGQPLRHAAGIVFCHHKAPVRRIKKIAQELAELAKTKDRKRNLFAYQILESFDHTGVDIEAFREGRLLAGTTKNDLILDGGAMEDFNAAMKVIKKEFPKRKLFRIVHQFKSDSSAAPKTILEVEKDLGDETKSGLDKVFDSLGMGRDCRAGWFHMLELWDYTGLDK
jgi:hypothetical protein